MTDDAGARARVRRDLSSTLFVEAGAGAGKTSVLVDRVAELVASGVNIESLAVITFTEAAAAELRERVRARLDEVAEQGDGERARRARAAVAGLDAAAISTLHAFAYRILAEEALAAGLPPQIHVVDDIASRIHFDRRWSDFVDGLHRAPELHGVLEIAAAVGLGFHPAYPGHRTLKDVAADLSDNWDRLDGAPRDAFEKRPSLGELVADIRTWCGVARAGLAEYEQRCVDDTDPLFVALTERIRPELARLAEEDDDLTLVRSLKGFNPWKVGNIGRVKSWPDCRDDVRSAVAEAGAGLAQRYALVAEEALGQLAPLVVRHVVDNAAARRASGHLEFHDLLVIARDLLRTDAGARARLHDTYTRILLDEFQDTDPIQIELAVLIAGNPEDGTTHWSDVAVPAGRLVVVGDPKQSIYRFRRADIVTYNAASDRFSDLVDGPTRLTANFRSVRPVVEWINELFGSIMAEGLRPGVPQAAFGAMAAVREPSPAGPADHRPVLLGGPRDLPAALLREEEARAVASTIADIASRSDAWPVAEPCGAWRAPRLSDIAVLVPARTSVPQLVAALTRADIPHVVATGSLLFDAPDVRDVVAVLRAVDDPTDPVKLVAALRSNLYACSDRHLAEAAAAGLSWSIDGHMAGGELDADHPVREAIEHLRLLVADERWRGASDIVERVFADRHAVLVPRADGDPAATWRRLRVLADRAQEFDVHVGGGLREFVRWIELQSSERSTVHEPMLDEPDVDAVRIMTIHGAKGLEFPIAIVSGLTTRLAPMTRQRTSVVFGNAGPEFKVGSAAETSRFLTQLDMEVAMDEAERVRLLYVATTRARDHLVVSAFHRPVRTGTTTSFGQIVWAHDESRDVEPGDGSRRLARRVSSPVDDGPVARPDPAAARGKNVAPEPASVGVPDAARRPAVLSPTAIAAIASPASATVPESETRPPAPSTAPAADVHGDGPDVHGDGPDVHGDGPDVHGDGPDVHGDRPGGDGARGAALGRAVHWVLERVEFDPAHHRADVGRLVDAAVRRELGVSPAMCGAVVRSALSAPTVQLAARYRHWREVPVCSEVGGVAIDGVVDLLIALPDGLLIVDFKTDHVATAEIDERVAHHRPQLVAYAAAVGRATGEPIAGARLIFLRPDGWDERDIDGIDAARAQLDERLRALAFVGQLDTGRGGDS